MDEDRKRTEISLTLQALFLAIAGISVVVFLLVTNHSLSIEKDWSLILLVYSLVVLLVVIFLLFPALLGEPFFTKSREEWDDLFEREIVVDLPYQTAFDHCLDSVHLLMRYGRLDWDSPSDRLAGNRDTGWTTLSYPNYEPLAEWISMGWWSDEGKIVADDRKNGIITVESHERLVSSFYPLMVPIRSTVTYSLKRLGHSQTQIHVKGERTRGYGPAYGINRRYVDAVCDFLLAQNP